jgi:hypothetical protein
LPRKVTKRRRPNYAGLRLPLAWSFAGGAREAPINSVLDPLYVCTQKCGAQTGCAALFRSQAPGCGGKDGETSKATPKTRTFPHRHCERSAAIQFKKA